MVFPSVNHLRAAINKVGMRQAAASAPVVIDCAHIFTSDYTAAAGFADMARDFRRRGQTALFMDMSPGVRHTYKGPDHDGEIKAVRSGDQLREALEGVCRNGEFSPKKHISLVFDFTYMAHRLLVSG